MTANHLSLKSRLVLGRLYFSLGWASAWLIHSLLCLWSLPCGAAASSVAVPLGVVSSTLHAITMFFHQPKFSGPVSCGHIFLSGTS